MVPILGQLEKNRDMDLMCNMLNFGFHVKKAITNKSQQFHPPLQKTHFNVDAQLCVVWGGKWEAKGMDEGRSVVRAFTPSLCSLLIRRRK